MGFTPSRRRGITDHLSLRGLAWSAGSSALCVLGGVDLTWTVIIAVIAYVKGS